MASFASSATKGGARKHAWTNNALLKSVFVPNLVFLYQNVIPSKAGMKSWKLFWLKYKFIFSVQRSLFYSVKPGGGRETKENVGEKQFSFKKVTFIISGLIRLNFYYKWPDQAERL